MADVTYKVVVDIAQKGALSDPKKLGASAADAGGKFDGLFSKIGSAAGAIGSLGQRVSEAFTGAVEAAGRVALGVGKIAAVGVGAGIAYGVANLNNELEKSKISIAAVLGAQGVTRNMTDGLSKAAGIMADMRKDAAELPGEFKDLKAFFTLGLNPALQAGAHVSDFRAMSAQGMAAAAATGVPMDQAAREFAQLLQGRAGAHNVFGMQLGFSGQTAEKFNKMGGSERIKELSKALGKFAPAIEVYKHSFEGLSSTFVDNVKRFGQLATAGIFEKIKGSLEKLNGWFDRNEDKIGAFASRISDSLGKAFDIAVSKIEAWGPKVLAFAQNASAEISKIWDKYGGKIESLADKGFSLLGEKSTVDKMETVLKAYGVAKVGGPLLGMAGKGLGGAFSAIGPLMQMGGSAGLGLAEAGPAGAVALAGIVVSLLEIAAVAAAIAGAVHAVTDASSAFHDQAEAAWNGFKANAEKTLQKLDQAWTTAKPGVEMLADAVGTNLLQALHGAAIAANAAAGAISAINGALASIGAGIKDFQQQMGWRAARDLVTKPEFTPGSRGAVDHNGVGRTKATQELLSDQNKALANLFKSKGGGGGTKIEKVEVTVSTSNDPNRVARRIGKYLEDIGRFPKSSPHVTNFSAARY
jgi:hypothetical protein